eukprot:CAMPEP_0185703078 /NCGR_PEP_ID=MMETSP1164-20130828/13596_1 /TAXON_ID=1104430 /ORGANISM="Chrysoreinhardia sp, Strain CCMP2950" /LENGTH=341 /DNA_ID=CAMNT_0028370345 /DNA_START=75 /DNA_END=1101 /DNA_ORIENTATION=+
MAKRDHSMPIEGHRWAHRWTECATCQQLFTGALNFEMCRRYWRFHWDTPASRERMHALGCMATALEGTEPDFAERLRAQSFEGLARENDTVLHSEIDRAHDLAEQNPDAALELLNGLRPRVATCWRLVVRLYYANVRARVLVVLGRNQEALAFTAEIVELATAYNSGPDSTAALAHIMWRGTLLITVGRVTEGQATLNRLLATQRRVLGAEHPETRKTESASKISQGCGLSLEGWYRRAACMPAGLPTQRPEASRIGRQRSDSLLQVVRQASSIRPSRGRRDGPDVCRLPFLFSILRQRRSVVPPSAPAPSGTQGTDLGRRRTTRPALSLSWLCCLAPVHI